MLSSSLYQLLPVVLSLVFSTGSVLADSVGTVPFKNSHSPTLGSGSCEGLFKNDCSPKTKPNAALHTIYCGHYKDYCSTFTGDEGDRVVYDAYCSKTKTSSPFNLNTCRDFASKNPTSTTGQGNRPRHESSSRFKIRDDATNNITADNLDVDTSDDVWYAVEITLGGEHFTVQLDTGSSDFWIHTAGRPVQLTNTTDLVTSETYGQRHVEGKIKFADLQVGNLTVERQAFLHATDVRGFDLSGYDGILGMAFDVGPIYDKVQQVWGTKAADDLALSPMPALFAQNPSVANNFDVQLSRSSELDATPSGLLTISSHVSSYENVTSAPMLPRVGSEHWSVAMDGMLINGQSFAFNQSRIDRVPAGRIAAALDTGSSFPALPPAAVDAIYGSVSGAVYDDISQLWLVPCDRSPNLTFVFGGQQFPVHPLDLTYPVPVTLPINDWDTDITACVNTFQYLTPDPTSADGFDIILADAFLYNVYASFDYGDWNPTNNTDGTPFVQMISTTDSATMWADFHANRTATLAQLPLPLDPALIVQYEAGSTPTDSADSASPAAFSSAGTTHAADTLSGALSTGETPSGGDDSSGDKYSKVVLALLGANLVVGAALLAVTLTICLRRGDVRVAPVGFNLKEPVGDP
ncbi:acid protease [Ganoderma leucocontextum]|nr:acid protease [Ganoderma leucocontextum]